MAYTLPRQNSKASAFFSITAADAKFVTIEAVTMTALEDKATADVAKPTSLDGNDHNTASKPSTVATAPEDSRVGEKDNVQDAAPEIVYPGPTKFALISLALCLIIYVITLVRLQRSSICFLEIAAVALTEILTLLYSKDSTVLATAVPEITNEFDSLKDVGWYSSVYFMAAAVTQLLYGRLYTRYTIAANYTAAMLFFLVGSAVCGAAPKSPALIVGRALAGVGCSGLLVGTFSLVPYIAHPLKQAMFMGLVGGTMDIGYATGPLIGGAFTQHVTWRWNVSSLTSFIHTLNATTHHLASSLTLTRDPCVVLHQPPDRRFQLCHIHPVCSYPKTPIGFFYLLDRLSRDV